MFEVEEEDHLLILSVIAEEIEKKSEHGWHVRPFDTT